MAFPSLSLRDCRDGISRFWEHLRDGDVGSMGESPRATLYGLLLVVVVAAWLATRAGQQLALVGRWVSSRRRPSASEVGKPALRAGEGSKGLARQNGNGGWEPVEFKRPTAAPAPNWDVHTSRPRPYRPFRYGKYHITMGLRNMKWDQWIELDSHYLKFHANKARRIRDRGSKCCYTAPDANVQLGAHELLEELCGYLTERYPSLYKATAVGLDNLLTGESFNVVERPLVEDPMQMCARLVQDDLAIMFPKEDGQYYLLAGAILLAGFWRLEDKLGMPLSEIHTSADVPGYREKLEKGMMNFMRRVQPNSPVERNNYFIQVDDDLAWSPSIGDEDGKEGEVGWFSAEKNKAIEHHYFRSERQTLRRLPRSGGVVFTIRTYFHPITEICEEPYVPGRLASAVRSWGDDVSKYKGRDRYGDVLLEYLDRKHAEQLAAGLDPDKEEEVRSYPF
ncbi:MAG: hypothetical protein M1818_000912 [Claussenomyces sp. TS43310]|nr:MAG: hypothetical protein M1818_000912 [Claussenomyces sp. TS43310]